MAAPKDRHGSENRQRVECVFVRMLPAQKTRLTDEAAAVKMSVAGYLLTGRLGENTAPPRRRPRRAFRMETEALMTALVAFSRAHNNLNQIAHAANTFALMADTHGPGNLREQLAGVLRAVDNLRQEFAPSLAAIRAALGP